jgi:hypothetical protein
LSIRSPFNGLRIPQALVCEFFGVFSRFEFVLKEGHFVIPGKMRAEPDWRRFSREAGQWLVVIPGSDLERAITYLNEDAPLVQTREDGWQSRALNGDTVVARAFDAACRVRNNLFHGGKHTPHSPDGRDEKLVRCALTLLIACLEQDNDLRATFEQTEF